MLRLPREETVEALLARLRLLRGLPSSIQGSGRERKGPCVRVSAADPLGTETGSGTPRSEEAEEKEPVVWGLGGWGGTGPGRHTNSDAKRGGRPWQLRGGGGQLSAAQDRE